MIKENCYWYEYNNDMGARIPYCTCQKGTDPLESCEGCTEYHSKTKKTNADRIRAMTDEELALYIHNAEAQAADTGSADTVDSWLDWLKSPVEEETE